MHVITFFAHEFFATLIELNQIAKHTVLFRGKFRFIKISTMSHWLIMITQMSMRRSQFHVIIFHSFNVIVIVIFQKKTQQNNKKTLAIFPHVFVFFVFVWLFSVKKKFICCDQQKLCHSGFSFLTHLPVDQKISSHLILVDCMSFVDLFMF